MTGDEKKSAVEIYRLHCGSHCIENLSTASDKNEAEVMNALGNIINNRIADSVAASVAELATNIQDSCAASTTKGGGSGCDVGKGGHGDGDDGSNDHSAPFHGEWYGDDFAGGPAAAVADLAASIADASNKHIAMLEKAEQSTVGQVIRGVVSLFTVEGKNSEFFLTSTPHFKSG